MRKFLAEFIGTFSLVIFGTGAAVISGTTVGSLSGLGLLGVSLAFGLALLVMVYTIGPISGCHINPAVSISMLVAGKLSMKNTLSYITAQCLGAIAASGILYLIISGQTGFNGLGEWALGANGWGDGYLGKYDMTAALTTEIVMTFIFLTVIFRTTSGESSASMAGLAIGLSLVAIHLVSIPITGTSVNPARSLAPALFSGGIALEQLWLFIVGPIIGGVLAAIMSKVCEFLR